jgi:hypothetical protein
MKAETTKAMQDALDAAVRSMNASVNGGNGNPQPAPPPSHPPDTIGAIMSIIPKLLQGGELGEEVIEKLESLQKGELASLKEQVLVLRKQCHRLLKAQEQIFRSQEQLLAQMREIQNSQLAANGLVTELVQQMARVEIIEQEPDEEDLGEEDAASAEDVPPMRHEQTNDHKKAQKTARTMGGRVRP